MRAIVAEFNLTVHYMVMAGRDSFPVVLVEVSYRGAEGWLINVSVPMPSFGRNRMVMSATRATVANVDNVIGFNRSDELRHKTTTGCSWERQPHRGNILDRQRPKQRTNRELPPCRC